MVHEEGEGRHATGEHLQQLQHVRPGLLDAALVQFLALIVDCSETVQLGDVDGVAAVVRQGAEERLARHGGEVQTVGEQVADRTRVVDVGKQGG